MFGGDPSQTNLLQCNGRPLKITQNLQEALCELRTSAVARSETPTCADVVCIDQASNLGEIYKRVAMVVVWLGPGEQRNAHRAFANIESAVEYRSTTRTEEVRPRVVHSAVKDPSVTELSGALAAALADTALGSYENGPLHHLFRRPCFSRARALEEVGLAHMLSSEWDLMGVITIFPLQHCKPLLGKANLAAIVHGVYHVYMTVLSLQPLATFIHVFNNTRPYMAKDPRDKLFTFLSHPTSGRILAFARPVRSVASCSIPWSFVKRLLRNFDDAYEVESMQRT